MGQEKKNFMKNTRSTTNLDAILGNAMASVAKWLRQWFVVPPFVGSSPIVRPDFTEKVMSMLLSLRQEA